MSPRFVAPLVCADTMLNAATTISSRSRNIMDFSSLSRAKECSLQSVNCQPAGNEGASLCSAAARSIGSSSTKRTPARPARSSPRANTVW